LREPWCRRSCETRSYLLDGGLVSSCAARTESATHWTTTHTRRHARSMHARQPLGRRLRGVEDAAPATPTFLSAIISKIRNAEAVGRRRLRPGHGSAMYGPVAAGLVGPSQSVARCGSASHHRPSSRHDRRDRTRRRLRSPPRGAGRRRHGNRRGEGTSFVDSSTRMSIHWTKLNLADLHRRPSHRGESDEAVRGRIVRINRFDQRSVVDARRESVSPNLHNCPRGLSHRTCRTPLSGWLENATGVPQSAHSERHPRPARECLRVRDIRTGRGPSGERSDRAGRFGATRHVERP
jgi:hypothetical protein